MEILIVKNGHVLARTNDDNYTDADTFTLKLEKNIPEYPTEEAPVGKYWDLDYVEGELQWVLFDRALTPEEQLDDAKNALAILGIEEGT